MKIQAVADVHSPRFLSEFTQSLDKLNPPDLFLLAGDMVNRGKVEEYVTIADMITAHLGSEIPVIACFGNEEYNEVRKEIVSLVGERILFLDEKSTIIECRDLQIGIVGTQGSLDKATSWQRRNVPSIKGIFERRAKRAASLLKKFEKKVDRSILLMHYSPCLETCTGEDLRAFSWLGSRKFYQILIDYNPDLVIHGHVHNSTKHSVMIGTTLVHNVALPAVSSITELDLWE
ncbi:MAG: metallophosphoesterase [Candidatus Thorarchaeota archaeon]|nr:metallophosphoesterase [Candidatus Thorarchaeota archaeon]